MWAFEQLIETTEVTYPTRSSIFLGIKNVGNAQSLFQFLLVPFHPLDALILFGKLVDVLKTLSKGCRLLM